MKNGCQVLQQQSRNKYLVTVFHRIPENETNLSTFKEYHCAGQVRCSMVGTVILLDTVHIIRNLLRAFFYLGRLFPLGHQIGSFSLESSETGTQYASTLPYHQQTHHFWMAVWSDQSKMSHSDSQKVAASCKSMAQCTLSQRVQCELFHLKVSL